MNIHSVNIALETYSVFISVVLISCLLSSEERRDKLNRLFVHMLVWNICVLGCDILVELVKPFTGAWVRPVLYVANFGVYSCGYVIVAIFANYVLTYIGTKASVSRRLLPVMRISCAAAVGLVALNFFNHMYFYFDASNMYHRGPWYWLSQAWAIGAMLAVGVIVLRHRRSLSRRDVFTLLSYQVLPVAAMVIQIIVYGLTLLYLSTTISILIIYVNIQVEQSKRLKVQERELTESRVAIMLSQIQPHFLYNALEGIGELCATDPSRAEKAVTEFSMFLRGNLNSITDTGTISFDQEMTHARHYLELEQMRFGKRLHVVWDTPVRLFRLPPLTLQPIVENAVRYGVTKRREGGTVAISTAENAASFLVTIKDDGMGFNPLQPHGDGLHIGIQNVRERLQTQCGGSLQITSEENVGTVVVITIPKEGKAIWG